MSNKFCRHCGNALMEGAKFCTSCGQPIGENSTAPVVTNNVNNITPNVANVTSAPVTNKEKLPFILVGIALLVALIGASFLFFNRHPLSKNEWISSSEMNTSENFATLKVTSNGIAKGEIMIGDNSSKISFPLVELTENVYGIDTKRDSISLSIRSEDLDNLINSNINTLVDIKNTMGQLFDMIYLWKSSSDEEYRKVKDFFVNEIINTVKFEKDNVIINIKPSTTKHIEDFVRKQPSSELIDSINNQYQQILNFVTLELEDDQQLIVRIKADDYEISEMVMIPKK